MFGLDCLISLFVYLLWIVCWVGWFTFDYGWLLSGDYCLLVVLLYWFVCCLFWVVYLWYVVCLLCVAVFVGVCLNWFLRVGLGVFECGSWTFGLVLFWLLGLRECCIVDVMFAFCLGVYVGLGVLIVLWVCLICLGCGWMFWFVWFMFDYTYCFG